eukprot:594439-Pleurochrysis_carterae.AAC.1
MLSQQLRVHMGVALSCVLGKPGRLMPPRSVSPSLAPERAVDMRRVISSDEESVGEVHPKRR